MALAAVLLPFHTGIEHTVTGSRSKYYEIWSRTKTGGVKMHGAAFGMTFEDACKQLACESLDFWKHFDKGTYQREKLHLSEDEALADDTP